MLKAQFDKIVYLKGTDGKITRMIQYGVIGTTKEIADYALTVATKRGVAVEELPKTEKGLFIYRVNPIWEAQRNKTPQASYDLELNYAKTQYFHNSDKDDMARWARISAKSEDALAAEMARAEFAGITASNTRTAAATPVAKPTVEKTEEQKMLDEIAGNQAPEVEVELEGLEAKA